MVAEKKVKKTKAKAKAEETAKQKEAENAKEVKAAPKPEKKEAAIKPEATKSAATATDPWSILKYPYLTEKSTRMIESQNKLVFMVKDRSTKAQIKAAVETVFGVKVADVNTTSTMRGEKKAYVRLAPEFKAVDIATKLGMM